MVVRCGVLRNSKSNRSRVLGYNKGRGIYTMHSRAVKNRSEVIEYLKELVCYDYNMGNSLYSVRMNRARYLHDTKMIVELEQLHYSVREFVEGLEDEPRS